MKPKTYSVQESKILAFAHLPPNLRSHIFDTFFQIAHMTSPSYCNFGLHAFEKIPIYITKTNFPNLVTSARSSQCILKNLKTDWVVF